ncbi:MAG: hypothetical protein Q6370_010645 [Candidatus Sigynarchaeota archaeon]|jgi:hypothetical protein
MSEPSVTVPLSTYDKLRDELKQLQSKNYELEKQLDAAKLGDGNIAKQLLDAFHATMKVVQFAVGNLDPATVAGWPYEALVAVAAAIETIPGIDRHIQELPDELRAFASVAKGLEEYRRERDKNKVVVPATAEDFGPKTPEAARVHAAYIANIGPNEDAATGDPRSVTQ